MKKISGEYRVVMLSKRKAIIYVYADENPELHKAITDRVKKRGG